MKKRTSEIKINFEQDLGESILIDLATRISLFMEETFDSSIKKWHIKTEKNKIVPISEIIDET